MPLFRGHALVNQGYYYLLRGDPLQVGSDCGCSAWPNNGFPALRRETNKWFGWLKYTCQFPILPAVFFLSHLTLGTIVLIALGTTNNVLPTGVGVERGVKSLALGSIRPNSSCECGVRAAP